MNNFLHTNKFRSSKFGMIVLGLFLLAPSFALALPSGTVNQQFLNLGSGWDFSKVADYHPNSTVRLQCWGDGGDGAPYSRSLGTKRTVVAGVIGNTTYMRDITSYTYGGGFGGGGGGYLEASFKLSDLVPSNTYALDFRDDFNTGGHYSHFKFQRTLRVSPYYPSPIFDVINGRGYDPSMPSFVNNAGGGYFISPASVENILNSFNTLSQMGSSGSGATGITGGAGGLGAGKEYLYPTMASTVGNGGRGTSIASAGPFDMAPAYTLLGLPAISDGPTITQANETGFYGQCVFTTVNGSGGIVNVSSNIPTTWKLTPALGAPITETGLATKQYINQSLGLYVIEWTVPTGKRIKNQSPNSLQLFDDSTVNFSVEFEDTPACGEGYLADSTGSCQPISCLSCAGGEGTTVAADGSLVCAPIECIGDQWWDGTSCKTGGGGSCGGSQGGFFAQAPTENLCTAGRPDVVLNPSTDKYEWTCSTNRCTANHISSDTPCIFNGTSIASGDSVLAYKDASSNSCISELRTCSNGTLSGSYLNQSCTPTVSGCNANPACDSGETIFSCPSQCKPKWWQF